MRNRPITVDYTETASKITDCAWSIGLQLYIFTCATGLTCYSERRTGIALVSEVAETIEDAFAAAQSSAGRTGPGRTGGTSALYAARNAYPVDQVLCTTAAVPAVVRSNWARVSSCSRPGEDSGAFAPSVEEACAVLAGPVAAQAAAIARNSPAISSVGSQQPQQPPPPPPSCRRTSGSLSDAGTSAASFY